MMAAVQIPRIYIVLAFLSSYLALAAASNYGAQEKASGSVVVTGNVSCDTCLEGTPSEIGYVISGASVAVECMLKTLTVSITGETDENGEFKVELPSNIFQSADQLSKCSLKPLKSPYNSCRNIPSKSAPSSLTLQSFDNGVLTYSGGSFSYRHETVPASCYKKDFLRMMRGRGMAEAEEETPINITLIKPPPPPLRHKSPPPLRRRRPPPSHRRKTPPPPHRRRRPPPPHRRPPPPHRLKIPPPPRRRRRPPPPHHRPPPPHHHRPPPPHGPKTPPPINLSPSPQPAISPQPGTPGILPEPGSPGISPLPANAPAGGPTPSLPAGRVVSRNSD